MRTVTAHQLICVAAKAAAASVGRNHLQMVPSQWLECARGVLVEQTPGWLGAVLWPLLGLRRLCPMSTFVQV